MLPGPADTARDLLIAAAWLRAAGYPAGGLIEMAVELLGGPPPCETPCLTAPKPRV